MNIELHLSGLTAAQVAAIGQILEGGSAPAPAASSRANKGNETATAAAAPETAKVETAKANTETAGVTVEQLTELGKAYASKNGRDAFVELLGGFGAKNISGVPTEQRAALLKKLEG